MNKKRLICSTLAIVGVGTTLPIVLTACQNKKFVEKAIPVSELNISASGDTCYGLKANHTSLDAYNTLVIPSNITIINNEAFKKTLPSNIKVIRIENGSDALFIGRSTFSYNASVEKIILPKRLEYCENSAFFNLTSLNTIDFTGWDAEKFLDPSPFVGNTIFKNTSEKGKIICENGVQQYIYLQLLTTGLNANWFDMTFEEKETSDGYKYVKAGATETILTGINTNKFKYGQVTKITIPANITYIAPNALYGVSLSNTEKSPTLVTSIDVAEGSVLKRIGAGAFAENSGIKSIDLTNATKLTALNTGCCSNCSTMEEIKLPESIESIGLYAFSYCRKITSFTIPKKVTCICVGTFTQCSSLTEVVMHDDITSIESNSFSYTALNRFCVPKKIQNFGILVLGNTAESKVNEMFWGAAGTELSGHNGKYGVTKGCVVRFTGTWPERGESVYYGTIVQASNDASVQGEYFDDFGDGKTICFLQYLTKYAFQGFAGRDLNFSGHPKLTIAENYAFSFCLAASINISNVQTLGRWTFECCRYLKEVNLNDNISEIPEGCFWNCLVLPSIKLPKSVTEVGNEAFEQCRSLTEIDLVDFESVPNWTGKNVFTGIGGTVQNPGIVYVKKLDDATKQTEFNKKWIKLLASMGMTISENPEESKWIIMEK